MVDHYPQKRVDILCWELQDFERPFETQSDICTMKTKLTLLVAMLVIVLLGMGCASTSGKVVVNIEGADYKSALPLVRDGIGNLPWTNRDYRFINVPKELTEYKYYQYTAGSGKGVTLSIGNDSTIKIIVTSGDEVPVTKLENDGWKKIGNIHTGDDNKDFRYNDRSRTRLYILSKDVKKGNLKINDYGSWGGIIVLTH
jgi:hypothetical protein